MMRKAASALLIVVLWAGTAQAAELRLLVKGVRSDLGELLIGLYASPEGFVDAIAHATTDGLAPDRGRLIGMAIRASAGEQSAAFTDLPPGRYAVIVVHDENDDGRLDANALGVPTEGYAFSNDARGFLSAPSFAAAAVTVGEGDACITLSLIYPAPVSDEEMSDFNSFIGSASAQP